MKGGGAHLDRIHNAHRGRLGSTSCGNHITKGAPR